MNNIQYTFTSPLNSTDSRLPLAISRPQPLDDLVDFPVLRLRVRIRRTAHA